MSSWMVSNPIQAFASALLGMGVYPEDIGLLFDVLDTRGTGEVTYVSFVNILARLRTQMNQVILFSITEPWIYNVRSTC